MKPIRPGMGTENSLKVIGALIQMTRPKTVLEIGAGDSSIAIAQALAAAKGEHSEDRGLVTSPDWSERAELLIPREALKEYMPTFVSIDNFSAEGCSANEAWKAIARFNQDGLNVKTVNADFFSLSDAFFTELGPIDFLWIDAGTFTDDVRFLGQLWPRLAPGGILALHEPYFTTSIEHADENSLAMVRTPLWEAIVKNIGENVDLLSLPETHKYRQTGLGLLRKRETWEQPRASSFQEEMICISEPPARFSVTGIRNDKMEALREATKKTSILKEPGVRKVLYAIGLGKTTLAEITAALGLAAREAGPICQKLVTAGLVEYANGAFCENEHFWSELPADPHRSEHEITDVNLETQEILDLIVSHLESDRTYTEAEISAYCRVFTDDFARLRRKLIDSKRLRRDQNIYSRTL